MSTAIQTKFVPCTDNVCNSAYLPDGYLPREEEVRRFLRPEDMQKFSPLVQAIMNNNLKSLTCSAATGINKDEALKHIMAIVYNTKLDSYVKCAVGSFLFSTWFTEVAWSKKVTIHS
jgi:hypothetical protein